MVEKINTFNEAIVIEVNKPYFPKPNRFGFIDIPYIKTMLLAGDTEREYLDYTWSCIAVSSTSMTFDFVFSFPLEISM